MRLGSTLRHAVEQLTTGESDAWPMNYQGVQLVMMTQANFEKLMDEAGRDWWRQDNASKASKA